MHEHIVEFKHGKSTLTLHSLFEAFRSEHGIDVKLGADFSEEVYIIQRSEPSCVVYRNRLARLRLLCLVSRGVNPFVSYIFPFIVEVEELIKEFLELIAVVFDGFDGHDLSHIGTP